MSEKDKTCGTCKHCLSEEIRYCLKNIHKRFRVRLGDAACEHYKQIKQEESRKEKMKRIEQRLEQLDEDFFAKKIDIEQYRRQQAFLVNKRNGLEAQK